MTDSKNGSLVWGMSSRELGGMILSSLVVTDSTIDLVFPSVLLTQFSMSALMLAFCDRSSSNWQMYSQSSGVRGLRLCVEFGAGWGGG